MAYQRTMWVNSPTETTPINDTNLNNMEVGILTNDTSALSGWNVLEATLTYASANTINTSVDLTGILGVGDKLKLTQTTVKYYYVIAITSSLITVAINTDYVVANAAITAPYYSHVESPFGFPQWFNYNLLWAGITLGNGNIVGKFKISNRCVTFNSTLTFGSTTSVSGTVLAVFPTNRTTTTAVTTDVIIRDAGVIFYLGKGVELAGGNTDRVALYVGKSDTTYETLVAITATVPITIATSDQIIVSGSYQIA
jgi:hypothetical protein